MAHQGKKSEKGHGKRAAVKTEEGLKADGVDGAAEPTIGDLGEALGVEAPDLTAGSDQGVDGESQADSMADEEEQFEEALEEALDEAGQRMADGRADSETEAGADEDIAEDDGSAKKQADDPCESLEG